MNVYTLDLGWRGGIVIIAESLEKAREYAVCYYGEEAADREINEHDATICGVAYEFLGDT